MKSVHSYSITFSPSIFVNLMRVEINLAVTISVVFLLKV